MVKKIIQYKFQDFLLKYNYNLYIVGCVNLAVVNLAGIPNDIFYVQIYM